MGHVSGLVTYQGSPLRGGTIHFIQSPKQDFATWIRGDGTYYAEVPIGVAKVTIETESVQSKDREGMLAKWQGDVGPFLLHKKKITRAERRPSEVPDMVYTPIPDHYGDPERSGIEVEINAGAQEFDFELVGSVAGKSP
jgi:hypothetical protein